MALRLPKRLQDNPDADAPDPNSTHKLISVYEPVIFDDADLSRVHKNLVELNKDITSVLELLVKFLNHPDRLASGSMASIAKRNIEAERVPVSKAVDELFLWLEHTVGMFDDEPDA